MFISFLAQEGLAYTSIKVYLSAVRSLHVAAGLHEIFSSQLTPRVEQVLKGVRKVEASKPSRSSRLPVTLDILRKVQLALKLDAGEYENVLLWAACCLAFFGFLRCSEFTVPSQTEYDPDGHLSLSDIAIDSRESPTLVQVNIKQSKTDPFRKGVRLCLGKTGLDICPVDAILAYIRVRWSRPGPLFVYRDGSYLTRQRFGGAFAKALSKAGIDDRGFTTHSFRIGAATTAKAAGISDVHIKMLGRWKSDAYQLYVRTPREQLAKLSKHLVSCQDTCS